MISITSSKRGSSIGAPVAALVALGLVLGAVRAAAQSTSDATIAESLFQDGKALMKQGAYTEACPKLAESKRLDPASGTALALAMCHEQQGKLASAWTDYLETEALARKDANPDRAKAARERANALAPKLARLEIVVGPELRALPGLEIRFDGVLIEAAVWGTDMRVDPGEHRIEARAAHKLPRSESVTIKAPAEHQRLEIGSLEDAPPEPAAPSPPVGPTSPFGAGPGGGENASDGSSLLVAGGVVGGLGLVGLGVGTFFGVRALDQIGSAQDRCSPQLCTDPEAVDLNDQGRVSADVSTGLFIGGGVVTAVGLVLLVAGGLTPAEGTASDGGTESALRVVPAVGLGGAGLMLGGSW
jgi:hypothetical protein